MRFIWHKLALVVAVSLAALSGSAQNKTNPFTGIAWPSNCNASGTVAYNFLNNTCFPAGSSVAPIIYRGAWSSATTYAKNDAVASGGNQYISLQNGNINHTPASSPTFWALLLSNGSVTAILPGSNITCTPLASGKCIGDVTINGSPGGGTPASPTLAFQFNNAGAFGGAALLTDPTGKSLYGTALNYVKLNPTGGQVTNPVFPQQKPYNFQQNVTQKYGLFDDILGLNIVQNAITGGANSQIDQDNVTSTSSTLFTWTPNQMGGAHNITARCYGVGDCVGQNIDVFGRGGARGQDERNESLRIFNGVTNDVAGGNLTLGSVNGQNDRVFNTTSISGYSQNFYEHGFITNISNKWASPGNLATLSVYGPNNLFADYHGDGSSGISAQFGASTLRTLTAPIDSKVYSGTCPTHTDTGLLYPQTGNNIGGGNGYITDQNGTGTPQANANYVNAPTGALVGYCATVDSTAGMSNGQVLAVVDFDYDFEYVKVISVVDSTHFTAFFHYAHQTPATISYGGGVGYGLGADADIFAANTFSGVQNDQPSPMQIVYPIVATLASDHVLLWNGFLAAGAADFPTYAYASNTPTVALTVSALGFSGGSITGLTGNFLPGDPNPNNYIVNAGTLGASTLPPPVVTVSSNCAVQPVLGFSGSVSFNGLLSIYTPFIKSGGTGGCTTATFTVAATQPQPFGIYPLAEVYRSVDPATGPTYNDQGQFVPDGNFTAMPLADATQWAGNPVIGQPMWTRGIIPFSQETLQGNPLDYRSPAFGPAKFLNVNGIQGGAAAYQITNLDPTRKMWGTFANDWHPTAPGDNTQAGGYAASVQGSFAGGINFLAPPSRGGNTYPRDGVLMEVGCSIGSLDASTHDLPCLHNLYPLIHPWSTDLGGTSVHTDVAIDPVTGIVTVNATSLNTNKLAANIINAPFFLSGTSTTPGSYRLSVDGVVSHAELAICNLFNPAGYTAISDSNTTNPCNLDAAGQVPSPKGILGVGDLIATNTATMNGLSSSAGVPSTVVSIARVGATGSTTYAAQLRLISPDGLIGIWGNGDLNVDNAPSSLSVGVNYLHVVCPAALQYGALSGSTYELDITNVTANTVTNAGTCPIAGTVDYSGTGTSISIPRAPGNGRFHFGYSYMNKGGALRWLVDDFTDTTANGGITGDAATGDTYIDGTGVKSGTGTLHLGAIRTGANCSSTASPAVCAAAAAGTVQVAAAATTLQINTTAITATSQIGCLTYSVVGITPPTNIASLITPYISATTAGTSFTVTLPVAPLTNPVNLQYCLIN